MNWNKFIEDTKEDYMGVAYSVLNETNDAQDVVQQTYLDLFITYGRYERLRAAGARSVHNKSLTMAKHKQPLERLNPKQWSLPSYGIKDDGQFMEELLKFVPRDKDMLLLSAYGYSLKEIAEKNNISHSYARKRIAKARKRLRWVAKMI
jgi:DNA-directed RNA polymerase specialized sigma24 family protein